jgi:hypothetical protein
MKTIRQTMINKYFDLLKDVKKNEEENFPLSQQELVKYHRVNTHVFRVMKELNLIKETGKSTYETKFKIIEPIMARKIINRCREISKIYGKNKEKNKIKEMPAVNNSDHEHYTAYHNLVKILFPDISEEEINNFNKVVASVRMLKEYSEKYLNLPRTITTFHLKPTLVNGVVAVDINFLEGTVKELTIKDLTL